MVCRVFLSYAREDVVLAQEMFLHMRNGGIVEPWLDVARLRPAQDWRAQLATAIAAADIVVCLASFYSLRSAQVAAERDFAAETGVPVQYWVLDDAAAVALPSSAAVRDLRSDPLSVELWDQALTSSAPGRSPRSTRPPYVDAYLEYWTRTLLVALASSLTSIGVVAGTARMSPGAENGPFPLYLGAGTALWAGELCGHLFRVRRRRAAWREWSFYARMTGGLFLVYAVPPLALVVAALQAGLTTAALVGAGILVVAGATVVLAKPSVNLALLTRPLGTDRYRTRSALARRDLARPAVTRRRFREPVVTSGLAAWSPAFARRRRSGSDAAVPLSAAGPALPPAEISLVGVVAVAADRHLATVVAARLGLADAVHDVADEALVERAWTPGAAVVFLLTSRSTSAFDRLFARLGPTRLVVVAVGVRNLPPQVRDAQVVDATLLDVDSVAAQLRSRSTASLEFEGHQDLRSVVARVPPAVTFLVGLYLVVLVLDWSVVGPGEGLLPGLAAGVAGTGVVVGLGFVRRGLTLRWLIFVTVLATLVTMAWVVSARPDDIKEWLFPPVGAVAILVQASSAKRTRDDVVALWAPATSDRRWVVLLATVAIAVPVLAGTLL